MRTMKILGGRAEGPTESKGLFLVVIQKLLLEVLARPNEMPKIELGCARQVLCLLWPRSIKFLELRKPSK